jgi:hypothetical protein
MMVVNQLAVLVTLGTFLHLSGIGPLATSTSFQSTQSPNTATTTQFETALAFTLQWEGGYVNHPADGGGKTYKGITQAKAQQYGVSDPRQLSDAQIKAIYQRDYWKGAGCHRYPHPLAMVCFDTAVNFGRFYFSENLPDDPEQAAFRVLQRRMAYRYQRVQDNPSQRVFLLGWLNRDRALERYLQQRANTLSK